MFAPASIKNTTYRVVLPFYVYAALSFLVATLFMFLSSNAFHQHYFHPRTLAITHTMALGWGTMIILGASHQLVPVLIEAKLFSNFLAYLSFLLAAIGIPLLVYSFFSFQFGWQARCGAILINAAILSFLVNLAVSISKSKHESIHALFVFTAAAWLLVTTFIGLLLVYNLTSPILPQESLHYLSLHAHIGIVGWFVLLVIGVGSRLIPMFLISKYTNPKRLWTIYWLINSALLGFILLFLLAATTLLYLLPAGAVLFALILFGHYTYAAYKQRIRKHIDEQMRLSLLSVLMMAVPLLFLAVLFLLRLLSNGNFKLVLVYGFTIFFGWITALILGMTFKTLPFIVWNKVYHDKAGLGQTPNPKDLFNPRLFNGMGVAYLAGFMVFSIGVVVLSTLIVKTGALLLLLTAVLYNWNVIKTLTHKPLIK